MISYKVKKIHEWAAMETPFITMFFYGIKRVVIAKKKDVFIIMNTSFAFYFKILMFYYNGIIPVTTTETSTESEAPTAIDDKSRFPKTFTCKVPVSSISLLLFSL